MSLWKLNPPEPTAAPTAPEEIGLSNGAVSLFGGQTGRCGLCNATPDTWLLTPAFFGVNPNLKYSGTPGPVLLKREIPYYPLRTNYSAEVSGCAWLSDEVVTRVTGANVSFARVGSAPWHPRYALIYSGSFDDLTAEPTTWWVIDFGSGRLQDGGQLVLGARWILTDDTDPATAQTPPGTILGESSEGIPTVRHFDCLGRNRFRGFDVSHTSICTIEPFYGD